ncbi:AI-2E family transporter [Candidatus Peregrinibacteria bacterium]|nr:AI-2E family transporter [Candidatus Peregrinibacteria bacterium]
MFKTERNRTNTILKYALFAVFTYLFALTIWPFIPSIVFALIFSVIFFPLFNYLHKKIKLGKGLSAFVVLVVTLIFIFAPLAIFVGLVANEAVYFAMTFDQSALLTFFDQFSNFQIFGYTIDVSSFKEGIQGILQNAAQVIYGLTTTIFANIAGFAFMLFVFVFLFIFFLTDSERIIKAVKKIAPFSKKQNDLLFQRIHDVSKTVFVGNLSVAILSGLTAFTAFTLFKIQSPIIWALLAGLLSLVPAIGTILVYLCGAVIVYFTMGITWSIVLLVYYVGLELVLLQSIIKPRLIDKNIEVHPILVFFSIIGGISAFSSMGIIYGPLIVVLFVSIFDFIDGRE